MKNMLISLLSALVLAGGLVAWTGSRAADEKAVKAPCPMMAAGEKSSPCGCGCCCCACGRGNMAPTPAK